MINTQNYLKRKVNVIPVDSNKRSIIKWKEFQKRKITQEECEKLFASERCKGIAVVTGAISENLEVIDVDCKYDITGSLFEDLTSLIAEQDQNLAEVLHICTTISGGYHIYYRCETICGNSKLAQRDSTAEELAINPHDKIKVLIETRGEGGYVIAPPTEGYKLITENDIPTITTEQRDIILRSAQTFNSVYKEIITNKRYASSTPYNKSPFADYNERGDVIDLLQKNGWEVVGQRGPKTIFKRPGDSTAKSSGDYHSGLNMFSVFTTSSQFEPLKGYKPSAVYCLLECGNDWSRCAKKLLQAGYGEKHRSIAKKYRKVVDDVLDLGGTKKKAIKELVKKQGIPKEIAKKIVEQIEDEDNSMIFWDFNPKTHKITINHTSFTEYLFTLGIGLYFYDSGTPIYSIVRNDNGRLIEMSTERIKKVVIDNIKEVELEGVEYTKQELLECIYKSYNIFTDKVYEFLPSHSFDFLRDTADTSYLPFKNGVVTITKDKVTLKNYGDIKKVIWASDVIDFNIDISTEDDECEFVDFLSKVCNNEEDRLENIMSILGYLCHSYKHPARTYAVILGEETEDESKGGGTGKGILVKALEKILNTVTIDGKNFRADKSFAYQRVSLDTKLVAIQDVDRRFDFEKFYSIITEGWTIEKKNKDELYVDYQDSPKVLLTTNYTINDMGNHAKRRQRIVEFSDYFTPARTPLDVYGHLLFDDWDDDEWNRFYNAIIICIEAYLIGGVRDIKQSAKYRAKKLRQMWGEQMVSFHEVYMDGAIEQSQRLKDLHSQFLDTFDIDKKRYGSVRFKKAMQDLGENAGCEVIFEKVRQDNNLMHVKSIKDAD